MGADEKHAATYHGREYTPSTGQVRNAYGAHLADCRPVSTDALNEFDRWLETVRAEAKAEALNESATYADEWVGIVGDGALVDLKTESEYDDTAEWLRARANQYKEEQ